MTNKERNLTIPGMIMLLFVASAALAPAAMASCPLITLLSPPASLEICGTSCTNANLCPLICQNTLNMAAASPACGPYTWTFTNLMSGSVSVFTTSGSSTTLNFALCGNPGDAISLVISAPGAASSPTYSFTGVACS